MSIKEGFKTDKDYNKESKNIKVNDVNRKFTGVSRFRNLDNLAFKEDKVEIDEDTVWLESSIVIS